MWLKLVVFFIALFSMEGVAWALHKYVMHGFLWIIHKSHHQKGKSFWEWNDLYFMFFAVVGSCLMIFGAQAGPDLRFYAGCGITAYGFLYLLVHDILIHQRIRLKYKPANRYLDALKRAHKDHHRVTGKHGTVSFGMLWVDKKYFRD